MTYTLTDLFCGAGGASEGLTRAGFDLKLAANHWQTAIDTHAANFPHAEHWCEDVNKVDMRRLPRTDVLWASPICTESSPAGGRAGKRRRAAFQGDLLEEFGHVEQAGFERTRATFWDVIRATEVHRYVAVLVENVPDVAERWELFDIWLMAMQRLGYKWQLVSANAAHIASDDNDPAAQWRDRLVVGLFREDVPMPDLTPSPLAHCEHCGTKVHAVQTWCEAARRRALRVGRYRRDPNSTYGQYWYTCPTCTRRVEPYVLPAATVIDWTDLGIPVPHLPRTLAATTRARITAGLAEYATGNGGPPFMVNANHDDTRVYLPTAAPLPSRTTKIGDGICVPPILMSPGGGWDRRATSVLGEPMMTRLANEKGHEAIAVPESFIAVLRNHATADPITAPLATVAAGGHHHALIVPYYTTGKATDTATPVPTVTGKDRFAQVNGGGVSVDNCRFRMIKPRESLRAQRFADSYVVTGGVGAQTMQAGNAVPVNLSQWIGTKTIAALDGRGSGG